MLKWLTPILFALSTQVTAHTQIIENVVKNHILPRYQVLAVSSQALANEAEKGCQPSHAPLIEKFHHAFDAWVGVSHVRFGPSERDNRAFALAFWPDSRSKMPKALNALIASQDPIIYDRKDFETASIAARGFYALEFLLFDETIQKTGDDEYRCNLVRAITRDIALTSYSIFKEWDENYQYIILNPKADGVYQSHDEVIRILFTSLLTGLEFTEGARIARPLGTFERPRPKRAEAYRSQRSVGNIYIALSSTFDLAMMLSQDNHDLRNAFIYALRTAEKIQVMSPDLSIVSNGQGRLKVEVLKQSVTELRLKAVNIIAPKFGISAGFNALDGDG